MEIRLEPTTIQYLWEELQKPPNNSRIDQAERLFHEKVAQGWFFFSDVEDIISLMDNRIVDYRFSIRDFLNPLGIPIEEVFFRPRVIATSALSYEAIRPEYFVSLLFLLERIGLQVNPLGFAEILLPPILKRSKTILSSAELEIFWYKKFRHKTDDVILFSNHADINCEPESVFKMAHGHTLFSYQNEENNDIEMLRIRAPKYRSRKEPVRAICHACGVEWLKGDPESSMFHRKEHKRRLSWLKPQPILEMVSELQQIGIQAEHVTHTSNAWKHKEMYNRALAFKREFHYDFVQWSAQGNVNPDAHGFLFAGENGEIVGACAFRNRTKEKDVSRWGLQWIWICPDERRKGHLEKRWSMFRELFGNFHVEPPVSDAMKSFLKKHGDTDLL